MTVVSHYSNRDVSIDANEILEKFRELMCNSRTRDKIKEAISSLLNSIEYPATLEALCRRLIDKKCLFIGKVDIVPLALYLASELQDNFIGLNKNFIPKIPIVESMYHLATRILTYEGMEIVWTESLSRINRNILPNVYEYLPMACSESVQIYFKHVNNDPDEYNVLKAIMQNTINEINCYNVHSFTYDCHELVTSDSRVIWIALKYYAAYVSSKELNDIVKYFKEYTWHYGKYYTSLELEKELQLNALYLINLKEKARALDSISLE